MHFSWMKFDIFTLVSGIAIMIMAIALWRAVEYRTVMPPGEVKRTWRMLIALIALFFFGYLSLPFFVFFPPEWKDSIVAFLFFFGSLYVIMTLNLVLRIVLSLKKD